jgi:long-chain acyl-CoA synthetase
VSDSVHERSADARSLPEWLLAQAEQRPRDVALRHKLRGVWQERSWPALRGDVVALAAGLRAQGFLPGERLLLGTEASPSEFLLALAALWLGGTLVVLEGPGAAAGPVAPSRVGARFGFASDVDALSRLRDAGAAAPELHRGSANPSAIAIERWHVPLPSESAPGSATAPSLTREWTHHELLDSARALSQAARMGANEDALLTGELSLSTQLEHLLALWLRQGFSLSFAEQPATADYDRRELGPSLIFGAAAAYAGLAERVLSNLPSGENGWGRWLRSVLGGGRGPAGRVGRRVLRHRLREVAGLARVRRALLLGSEPLPAAFERVFGVALLGWPAELAERGEAQRARTEEGAQQLTGGFEPELTASRSGVA